MQTYLSAVLLFLLSVFCVILRLTDAGPLHNSVPKLLKYLNDIPEEKSQIGDREKYLTNYVRNLYDELSFYDAFDSLVVRDAKTLKDVEKQLANVHMLHQTSGSGKVLKFDASSLPRNLHISHAELVIPSMKANPTETNEEDDYNVSDVTKEIQSLYISNVDELVINTSKEIPPDENKAQLVIFENVNNTLLTFLRSRPKRGAHQDWHQEKAEKNACSVSKWEVNFEEIGWDSWLWIPRSYYANFCSGGCVQHRDKFTEHATLKVLLMKIQKVDTRISVVCSPYEYKPLTVLYINKHNIVVMKQIPNAGVVSCICR